MFAILHRLNNEIGSLSSTRRASCTCKGGITYMHSHYSTANGIFISTSGTKWTLEEIMRLVVLSVVVCVCVCVCLSVCLSVYTNWWRYALSWAPSSFVLCLASCLTSCMVHCTCSYADSFVVLGSDAVSRRIGSRLLSVEENWAVCYFYWQAIQFQKTCFTDC